MKSMTFFSGFLKNSMATSTHPKALNAQAADDPVEHHLRAEDAREERGHDADHQRHGEAADRARSVLEEDDRRDERGQLAVEDRRERLVEALLDGAPWGLPQLELFSDAL